MVTAYCLFPAWGLCPWVKLLEKPWSECSGIGLMRNKGFLQKGHVWGAWLDAKSRMERHSRGKPETEQRLESGEREGLAEVPQGLSYLQRT